VNVCPAAQTIASAAEPRLVRVGALVAALAGCAALASQTVNELVLETRHRHLNLDAEWNLWAWAGSASIAAAAVSAALVAIAIRSPRARVAVLSLWFVFLSADDVLEVHERIGMRLGRWSGHGGNDSGRLWVIVYFPAMVVALMLLLQIARTLCSAEARRVLHAGLVLIGLAVAAEVTGALMRRVGGALDWTYDVSIALEEAGEVAGWLLIATALAAAAFSAVAAAERR
jgi:hypothetical protein